MSLGLDNQVSLFWLIIERNIDAVVYNEVSKYEIVRQPLTNF